ncbi:MAG TPA: FecR family protein [Candidatus Eremiobacteraceae bacterium]|nr:FecR family protein [Candidatus Eremiobacteraceae bacterium]
MKRLSLTFLCMGLAAWLVMPRPADGGDVSHARIVRLSLVQGDVRFAREFHKDALEDSRATWEVAPLNLPIRQGYAVATDNGRAEVEFENGAMAFLSANTVLEFYDLSLDEGAHITRLILRQGSGIFYVHPGQNDYFSVTGGDFSVEASGRSRFRLHNFDDGSNLSVEQGQVNVLRNKTTKALVKGQTYSVDIYNASAPVTVARVGDDDDFDKWVSGRIDAVATATAYSSQYVNSSDYTSGFADLYNYGAFYNVPGYGFCWQPFGVGIGWNPFAFGNWYNDASLGWGFISFAPWGWLPYHYGSWIFGPMGWMWAPTGFGFAGGYGYGPGYGYGYGSGGVYHGPIYHPITAVWVHSGGNVGLVPLNPADKPGKAPVNLAQGVYMIRDNALMATTTPASSEKWSVIKDPPRSALATTTLAASTQPTRVSRTILAGTRPVTLSRDSTIVYDPAQHRFVNNTTARVNEVESKVASENAAERDAVTNEKINGAHNSNVATTMRGANLPARPHISPPAPPSYSHASNAGMGGSGAATAETMSGSSSGHSSSGASSGGHGGGGGGGHH